MRVIKNVLINAGLVVASLVVGGAFVFTAGEIFLHTRYGSLPPGPPVEWHAYDVRRGWTVKPGRYSYFNVQALRPVDVSINDLGLRTGPVSGEPGPEVERVTILGDSFVFGPSVNDAETIPAQLQALAGSSFEVVNVSAPGYGTGQQYRFLEELQAKGYRIGGKLVIVFFTNDILDNLGITYGSLERNPWQPIFSVDASGKLQQTVPQRFNTDGAGNRSLLARSLFIPFVRYHLEVLAVSYPVTLDVLKAAGVAPALPYTPGIIAGWYGPQWDAWWAVTEDVLEYVVRTVRALDDAPEVFIAFVPSPFQVNESFRRTIEARAATDARYASFLSDPDRPQRVLRLLARRLDVPFIDMTPEVRREAGHSLVYFPREGHFTGLGCAIAAKVIYEQAFQKERVASSLGMAGAR